MLNSRKFVRVRPTLQLQEYTDIFALGDIIDWKEQKQVAKAWGHAGIVAANVDAHLSGRKLKDYKGSPEMILITNGKVWLFCFLTFACWSDLDGAEWWSFFHWDVMGYCLGRLVYQHGEIQEPVYQQLESFRWTIMVNLIPVFVAKIYL